jgi:hypothetical protein
MHAVSHNGMARRISSIRLHQMTWHDIAHNPALRGLAGGFLTAGCVIMITGECTIFRI